MCEENHQPAAVTGRVFDIQRFSIHDGPGIRTTVFLKGCVLRCVWCHNPEGIAPDTELSFIPEKCIGCGYCFRVCPHSAHELSGDTHQLARNRCVVCGACTEECYAGALELVGKLRSVREVLDVVLRDQPFYETSHGGLTISGGEPLVQIAFTEALLKAAKEESLHCCLETCGYAAPETLSRIADLVDLFLFDLKEMNEARHIEYTGVSNRPIIANLKALYERGARIRLRVPVIPGYNDRPDNFEAVAALVAELPNLEGVELMPYHPLGEDKRLRLGWEGERPPLPRTPDDAQIAAWIAAFADLGVAVMNR